MDLQPLRHEIDTLLQELAEETYLQRAGLKTESRCAGIYDRYAPLFQRVRLEEVQAIAAEGGAAAASSRLLLEFLTHAHLEAETVEVTDRILREEASTSVLVEERTIPLRGAEAAIQNEADRARRSQLDRAYVSAVSRLNPLLQERLQRLGEAAARRGAASYPVLWQERSGIDLDAIEKPCHDLLDRTEEMYVDTLKWMLKRQVGVSIREARRHDLAYLFRGGPFDRLLPSGGIAAAVEAAAHKMRIDPKAGGRIQVDTDVRPTKSARSFVAPIEVPQRVILVVRPGGGWTDARGYLNGLGQALQLANIDATLPVEFRRLGDASLTQAFACLFEGLLLESGFLRRFLEIARERDLLHCIALHKLHLIRCDAARLLYERGLYDGAPYAKMAEAYRDLLSRAAGVEWPAELYLYDLEPAFAVARSLQARIFEARFTGCLYNRFDEEWYRNDQTGPFLLQLWRQGQGLTLEQLAGQLDLGSPNIEPLIDSLTRHLA